MSDDVEHERDEDSICFVKDPNPEPKVDFNKPIYQVCFYFGSDVAMVALNADSNDDALNKAIERIRKVGNRQPTTANFIEVTELLTLRASDGES